MYSHLIYYDGIWRDLISFRFHRLDGLEADALNVEIWMVRKDGSVTLTDIGIYLCLLAYTPDVEKLETFLCLETERKLAWMGKSMKPVIG